MDRSKRRVQDQNMLPIGRSVDLRITASSRFVVGFRSCIKKSLAHRAEMGELTRSYSRQGNPKPTGPENNYSCQKSIMSRYTEYFSEELCLSYLIQYLQGRVLTYTYQAVALC
jgi:hypothetical protein